MSNVHHLALRWLCLFIAAASAGPLAGQQVIRVLSDSISRPGQVCSISADDPFDPKEVYYVMFGSQSVQALGCDEAGRLWVQVPLIDEGLVAVKVYNDQNSWSGKNMQVLPAPALAITMLGSKSGAFKKIQSTPAPAWWSNSPQAYQKQLAFDLIDNQGRLVYSGIIADPFECGDEVFEGPEKPLFRAAVPEAVQFALLIPNLPKLTEIRFYQVPYGVEARTEKGFQQRIYLGNFYF